MNHKLKLCSQHLSENGNWEKKNPKSNQKSWNCEGCLNMWRPIYCVLLLAYTNFVDSTCALYWQYITSNDSQTKVATVENAIIPRYVTYMYFPIWFVTQWNQARLTDNGVLWGKWGILKLRTCFQNQNTYVGLLAVSKTEAYKELITWK